MRRVVFFNELEAELKKQGINDIDGVIRDYEELFIEGMRNGKTEEQIIDSLELPEDIARSYKTKPVNVKQGKKELNSKIKLGEFMNLVFIGLIVYFTIDLIINASIMPSGFIAGYIAIIVASICLICVYTKNLSKLKSKEKELNNIAKKDLEGENE